MGRKHKRASNFDGNRGLGLMTMCPNCGRLVRSRRWLCDDCGNEWGRRGEKARAPSAEASDDFQGADANAARLASLGLFKRVLGWRKKSSGIKKGKINNARL